MPTPTHPWLDTLPADPQPPLLELWPEGPPSENGLTHPEGTDLSTSHVSIAQYQRYEPQAASHAPRSAIVVIPGGGYGGVSYTFEGTCIARWLNARGIVGLALKYRLPNQRPEIPGDDARRALRLLRENAAEWNIDPHKIGVWGFSAGGHLAATLCTQPDQVVGGISSLPDFSILSYPVISAEAPHTHKGSYRNLLGEAPPADLVQRYSPEHNVTDKTPPAFLFHAANDQAVPYRNSLDYFAALQSAGVPSELHLYHQGGHGPGVMWQNAPAWESALEHWLRRTLA